ncbi:MAG: response regulator transcription factor [Novosphingobium sp.]|jgi:two-component system phosphate regulon response regulator PhoB
MRHIDILLTSDLAGGREPFAHSDLRVVFHRWKYEAPLPLMEGSPWAFIDWVLDEMSGLELCRRLRSADSLGQDAHITMILEEDDAEAKRRALRAGADDYIIAPIERSAVLDRVLSVRLPEHAAPARVLKLGELTLDLSALQARWRDKPLGLMPNELRLLRYLMEKPGHVFSRQQLITALGKHDQPIDERTVDAWVSRLRRSLRDVGAGSPLRTVRSLGYVLDRP